MAQENVEIVRSAYAALSEGDLDALAELTHPDWVFDFSRSIGPQKGVYYGREEVARLMASTREAFERFRLSPVEFSASGTRIAVRHHLAARGRGSGVEIDRVPSAVLLWEVADGTITRTTLYQSQAEALEAAALLE